METYSPTHKQLGEKVRKLRLEKQLTQEQLSELIGIDRTYVGFIERGQKNPTLSIIMGFAEKLNVEIKELFNS